MTLEQLTREVEEPLFNKKDVHLTYRALNHYESKGLLLSLRKATRSWRKFTAVEVIWLNLISALREMGMSLAMVSNLYKNLFIEGRFGNVDKANFINKPFSVEIVDAIFYKKELYILIFSDATYTFHDSSSLAQWHNGIYKNEPHINIPLTNMINEIMGKL